MKRLCTLLALGGLIASASAQIESTREKVRRKVAAMRKAMREGRIREYNVYVKVRLQNGNRMRGVVKNGKFVELHDGIDFVSASRVNDKGAGMRVWYTAGQKSYVFLRYDQIQKYTIGSKLSDEQVKSIEHKLEKDLADTRENYKRMRDELAKKRLGDSGDLEGGTGASGEGPKLPTLTAAQKKLLEDFPATAGWGKQKLDKLKQRRITLGVFPNPKEARFERSYDKWAAAYDLTVKIEKMREEAADVAKTTGSTGSKTGESKKGESKTSGTTGAPTKPPK